MATADISEVALSLAVELQPLFPGNTLLEVVKAPKFDILFRNDYSYYFKSESKPYNPFDEGSPILGDVYCNELPFFVLPQAVVEKLQPLWEYQEVANPLLFEVVADYLTFRLNEEQPWAALHSKCGSHLAQNYVSLTKLVALRVPELIDAYNYLLLDINHEKENFIREEQRKREYEISSRPITDLGGLPFLSYDYALQMYEVRGKQYENVITQDFWDKREIQTALNEVAATVSRIISTKLNFEASVAERSLDPAFGYDVYQVLVANNRVNVKNLGDYRILHWELTR